MLYDTQNSLACRHSLLKLKREPIATAPGSWFLSGIKQKNMLFSPQAY